MDQSASPALPDEFAVESVYPTPFNVSVTVPFALPQAGEVTFKLFNVPGQRVFSRTRTFQAGMHSFLFDAAEAGGSGAPGSGTSSGLVSGVYLLKISFDGQQQVQKLILIK